MIEVHFATLNEIRWIGVDLNTTGHVAVAADPLSGKILKLGKSIHHTHTHSVNNCTKFWKEGKIWKLKKLKTRERKSFKAALAAITRQIVNFSESMGTGIKFEKLFSNHYTHHEQNVREYEFTFDNGSFFTLQKMVEQRAHNRGIPVLYVNPAYTSKRCCRCGEFGRRFRKRFECPHCGYVVHADVNAAFNIATTPIRCTSLELFAAEEDRAFLLSKKQMRRMAKAEARRRPALSPAPVVSVITEMAARENLLAVLELG
ncbi:MAG: zinc ribbon domain-containing protein [Methanoregula sp.]